jgi:DNA-directed RNA polymerase specialized sigma24 family protein
MPHFERVARAAALVIRDAAAGQDLAQEAFTRSLERCRSGGEIVDSFAFSSPS